MSWIGQTGASLFQAMQQKSRAHSHFQTLIPFRTRHSVCRDGWRRCQFLPTFSSRPFSGFLDPPDSRNRSLPTSSRGEHVDLGRAGFFTQSTFLAPTPPTHTATLSLSPCPPDRPSAPHQRAAQSRNEPFLRLLHGPLRSSTSLCLRFCYRCASGTTSRTTPTHCSLMLG